MRVKSRFTIEVCFGNGEVEIREIEAYNDSEMFVALPVIFDLENKYANVISITVISVEDIVYAV